MTTRRIIGLSMSLLLAFAGCSDIVTVPAHPEVICRTGDAQACQQAANAALAQAPKALGTPARLIVDSGGFADCDDRRPNVCPWQVELVYEGNGDTFSERLDVQRASTGEWLLVRVVTPQD